MIFAKKCLKQLFLGVSEQKLGSKTPKTRVFSKVFHFTTQKRPKKGSKTLKIDKNGSKTSNNYGNRLVEREIKPVPARFLLEH